MRRRSRCVALSPLPSLVRACWSAAAALAVMVGATTATPAFTFDYVGQLPLERGASTHARPEAVAVHPSTGEICVTEAAGSALHLFNADGAPVFTTSLAAGLSTPASACLDDAGHLVCTDSDGPGRRTIRQLDFRGEPTPWRPAAPRRVWNPLHLLVTGDGNYVALDPGAALLTKHDVVTGALLWVRELGGENLTDLGLGRPCEGPDRTLYVPGGELHQVLVLDPEGNVSAAFGELGSAPGRFVAPIAVAPGPEGTLAVLDRMRHRVLLFGLDRQFLAEFGAMGAEPGNFYHPLALATSVGAKLAYVSQGYGGRVQVFRLDGLDPPAATAASGAD